MLDLVTHAPMAAVQNDPDESEEDNEVSFVFDCETDGFNPTVVHCLVLKCLQTGETFVCADYPGYLPLSVGLHLLMAADWVIGHNVLRYDLPVMERLCEGFAVNREKVIDTLPLAQAYFSAINTSDRLQPHFPATLRGKQSLKAWGYRCGLLKGEFGETADWKRFTPAMATYCVRDVEVTALLHEVLELAAMAEAA